MRLRTVILLILGSIPMTAGAATIRLKALPATVRVRQEGPVGGADTADIFGARGEWESFQVVVTAMGGGSAGSIRESVY